MKTLRRVSTSERLPTKEGIYFVVKLNGIIDTLVAIPKNENNRIWWKQDVEYWYEEIENLNNFEFVIPLLEELGFVKGAKYEHTTGTYTLDGDLCSDENGVCETGSGNYLWVYFKGLCAKLVNNDF
jgi:hypothetical protein